MSRIVITKRDALIYLSVGIVVVISIIINLGTDDDVLNILTNFMLGSCLLFVGLSVENRKFGKKSKLFLLSVALLWLSYLSLHYLIGFHNPYWGN